MALEGQVARQVQQQIIEASEHLAVVQNEAQRRRRSRLWRKTNLIWNRTIVLWADQIWFYLFHAQVVRVIDETRNQVEVVDVEIIKQRSSSMGGDLWN